MLKFSCSIILFFVSTVFAQAKQAAENLHKDPGNWTLIFKEDFHGNGMARLDYWSFSQRNNASWARFLSPDPANAFVKNGKLNLLMTNIGNQDSTSNYKSAGMTTKGKFSFKYGKVEVKAKFNQATGSWPAIWLMPVNNKSWPETGEIDIMEHLNRDDQVFQTVHSAILTSKGGASSAFAKSIFKVDRYNIYGLEWTAESIKFFVNRKLTYTYEKKRNATEIEWPFDHPFYLLLNQSGGAGWPGKADPKDFPFEMKVDWVKIYQKK